MYDWAADIEELRTKWLEMLGYASENAKLAQVDSTKMLTQHGETPAAVQVSCSFFQEHGTFGFSKVGLSRAFRLGFCTITNGLREQRCP